MSGSHCDQCEVPLLKTPSLMSQSLQEPFATVLGQGLHGPQSVPPTAAIATRWGFSDIPHFTREFGQHFVCAPSNFRRRMRM